MSTQAEVDTSYGLDNEFFRLWLDQRMNYTCALFHDTDDYSDDFERAQDQKLQFLSRLAHIDDRTRSVLDIGCGWGANLEYQSTVNGVPEVEGITLCRKQSEYCRDRGLPGVTARCVDYRDYDPPHQFEAVMSICMIEHTARPKDARSGKQIAIYRNFFERVRDWSVPGSYLALQCITRRAIPRGRDDLDRIRHANEVIFPGGMCPRVEDVILSAHPHFEIMEMYSRRLHYRRTSEHWLSRLRLHEDEISARWGRGVYEDYERYLETCVLAFERGWQSLHQFSLRRCD